MGYRMSYLPTRFGERISIRVLDESRLSPNLRELGFNPEASETLRAVVERPGLMLLAGPRASGKTVTVCSLLTALTSGDHSLVTSERRIEYDLDGVDQCELSDELPLARVLAHDADVFFVAEPASDAHLHQAADASLAGARVIATITEGRDSVAVLADVVRRGGPSSSVAATLDIVATQRLVRRLCSACRAPDERGKAQLQQAGFDASRMTGGAPYHSPGCSTCSRRGHVGRVGLFEVLSVNERIARMSREGAAVTTLREVAAEAGVKTRRDTAEHLVGTGQISLGESTAGWW